MLKNPNFPGGNPIPFNDPANATPVTINTTQNTPARVSYLGYTAGALTTTNTVGDAHYNSLQAQLRHNFSNGILLQASYTWSRNITNVNSADPGLLDVGQTDFGTSGSNNPLDFAQQYGPYSGERSQRLILSYSYDLPWKSTEGFSGKVLSGWTVSGVTTLQNGQPFTVTDARRRIDLWGREQSALVCSNYRKVRLQRCMPTRVIPVATLRQHHGARAVRSPRQCNLQRSDRGLDQSQALSRRSPASLLALRTVSGESPIATGSATATCGATPFFRCANYEVAGTG